ncbi:MAG: hypothetical protein IAG10_26070 [Planctomycetaceae bacterium]|nr:hypothetical protein [Planctomycetaceae bacterium]
MMSKRTKSESETSGLRPEYDFSSGVRGKHHRDYQRGHRVKIHKTDGTTTVECFKLKDGETKLQGKVVE